MKTEQLFGPDIQDRKREIARTFLFSFMQLPASFLFGPEQLFGPDIQDRKREIARTFLFSFMQLPASFLKDLIANVC